jgi:hypothetical protein
VAVLVPDDVNGDGFRDILIGSVPDRGLTVTYPQQSYLLFGARNLTSHIALTTISNNNTAQSVVITGGGVVVSGVGDINGDGFDDVMVGSDYGFTSGGGYVILFPTEPIKPSNEPTTYPSDSPTWNPTHTPTGPTFEPSMSPVGPSQTPSAAPIQPTQQPSVKPTTSKPSHRPSTEPSPRPSRQPSVTPSAQPSGPTCEPSRQPSVFVRNPITLRPTATTEPSSSPVFRPSDWNLLTRGNYTLKGENSINVTFNTTEGVFVRGFIDSPVIYTVVPYNESTHSVYTIEHFKPTLDLIDLRHHKIITNYTQLIITSGSVVITLPTQQIIRLLNMQPINITSNNFIFSTTSDQTTRITNDTTTTTTTNNQSYTEFVTSWTVPAVVVFVLLICVARKRKYILKTLKDNHWHWQQLQESHKIQWSESREKDSNPTYVKYNANHSGLSQLSNSSNSSGNSSKLSQPSHSESKSVNSSDCYDSVIFDDDDDTTSSSDQGSAACSSKSSTSSDSSSSQTPSDKAELLFDIDQLGDNNDTINNNSTFINNNNVINGALSDGLTLLNIQSHNVLTEAHRAQLSLIKRRVSNALVEDICFIPLHHKQHNKTITAITPNNIIHTINNTLNSTNINNTILTTTYSPRLNMILKPTRTRLDTYDSINFSDLGTISGDAMDDCGEQQYNNNNTVTHSSLRHRLRSTSDHYHITNTTPNTTSPRTPGRDIGNNSNKPRTVSFDISVNVTSSIQHTTLLQRARGRLRTSSSMSADTTHNNDNNIYTDTTSVVVADVYGANSESHRSRSHTYSYDAYLLGSEEEDSGDDLGTVSSGVRSEI